MRFIFGLLRKSRSASTFSCSCMLVMLIKDVLLCIFGIPSHGLEEHINSSMLPTIQAVEDEITGIDLRASEVGE